MENFEFVSEDKDYSVPEFHDRFHKCLPKIVVVNQGVCNDRDEEAFGKGEVIVIGAISRQKRVITQLQINEKNRLISIPQTYTNNLCLVKQKRPGKEDTLLNILANNKLPITVCFPRNRTISLGVKTVNSNRIPHLTLTEAFDEVYLLGNYINDGEICKDIITVPLHLTQLRVSLVKGIKGKQVNVWKTYKRRINEECYKINYQGEFGNQEIAEYDPKAVHTGSALSYLEPLTYENIVNIVQSNESQALFPDMTPEEIDDLGLYEDVPIAQEGKELYYNQPENNKVLLNEIKSKTQRSSSPVPNIVPTYQPLLSDKSAKDKEKQKVRPPIAPKPVLSNNAQQNQASTPPALPARQVSRYKQAKTGKTSLPDNSYSNIRPTNSVVPTVHVTQPPTGKEDYQGLKRTNPYEGKYRSLSKSISSKRDVEDLSVKEVCEYLRALNLSQYEAKFREHMIDGAMLVALEPEVIQEDIGMKKIEVVRLMKFAKEGRLPIQDN